MRSKVMYVYCICKLFKLRYIFFLKQNPEIDFHTVWMLIQNVLSWLNLPTTALYNIARKLIRLGLWKLRIAVLIYHSFSLSATPRPVRFCLITLVQKSLDNCARDLISIFIIARNILQTNKLHSFKEKYLLLIMYSQSFVFYAQTQNSFFCFSFFS